MTKYKIMIVDDSELMLEIYKNALQTAGFEVITRNTPFGTAALIASEKPDLVLLDIFMPALSGDRLVEVVKKDKGIKKTKIVLFSNRPEGELESVASACGADGFIQKTGDYMEVVRKVRSLIEG